MRVLFIFWLGLLGSCAAPHAARVACDGKLRPINVVAPIAGAALADTPSVKAVDGVP